MDSFFLSPTLRAINSSGRLIKNRPLVSVFAGNSIAAFGKWDGTGANPGGYSALCEYGYAQQLVGSRVTQLNRATIGTYIDACGNYGHGGYSLVGASNSLMSELASVHFAALDAGGIVPDLWIDLSLFENDIGTASSDTSATVLATLDQRRAAIKAKYPGIIHICCTPRPDGRNSTAVRKTMQAAIYAGVMSRDDGTQFFACDVTTGTYGTTADQTIPQAGYTYTNSTSDPLTDVANVHPRQNAASINGRRLARTIARVASEPVFTGQRVQTQNDGLFGSTVYSSNKTTGTVPTNGSIVAAPSGASAAIVSTALQPGWRLVFTPDSATLNDTLHAQLSALTLSPEPMRFQVYAVVKINSGASCLSSIVSRAVVVYSSGNSTHLSNGSLSVVDPAVQPCVYADGDILTLISPDYTFTQGVTVTNLTSYVRAYYYAASAGAAVPLDITIFAMGILPVGRAPLAVTPSGSPFSYTAPLAGLVVITGGTVSAIELTRNGLTYITLASATGQSVRVSRGDIVRVTYTVAPTMTFIADNPPVSLLAS